MNDTLHNFHAQQLAVETTCHLKLRNLNMIDVINYDLYTPEMSQWTFYNIAAVQHFMVNTENRMVGGQSLWRKGDQGWKPWKVEVNSGGTKQKRIVKRRIKEI